MAEGKPYRYGLIAAGLCVASVGLFVMIRERPHVYGTMCALGVVMIFVGTVWSVCQCFPKVILVEEKSREDLMCTTADAKHERRVEAPAALSGHRFLPGAPTCRRHSCPTLNLV